MLSRVKSFVRRFYANDRVLDVVGLLLLVCGILLWLLYAHRAVEGLLIVIIGLLMFILNQMCVVCESVRKD